MTASRAVQRVGGRRYGATGGGGRPGAFGLVLQEEGEQGSHWEAGFGRVAQHLVRLYAGGVGVPVAGVGQITALL